MAKAKKSKARTSKAKKSRTGKTKAKKTKKAAKRAAAASSRKAKKSKAPKRAIPKKVAKKSAKPAKKAAPKMKKQAMGEGNYEASRKFLKDQAGFVKRHKAEVPQMGKEAEAAMDGPQGGELRAAEQEAMSHSKAPGNES